VAGRQSTPPGPAYQSPTPTAGANPGAWSRLWRLACQPTTLVAGLILATLVARAAVLSTPISRVRPTLTAMITRNLGRDLAEIGPRAILYPHVDFGGDQPGYLLQEFPVMNLAGVFLERVAGLSIETAYRTPSLVCFALMLPFLFAFVRARFGVIEAVAAVLVACVLPLVVEQSVEVMPEQGVVTAFLAATFYFDRHLEKHRPRDLVAAAVGYGLMLLTKPTSGLLFLVPLGLFHAHRGGLRGLYPRYLAMAVACALPLGAWLVQVWRVNPASIMDDGRDAAELAIDNYLGQHDRPAHLSDPVTYGRFVEMLVQVYGLGPLLLFVAGCIYGLCTRGRNRALLAWWIASFLLYFLVLPFNTTTHQYYTHPYSPLIALGGALALAALVRAGIRFVPAGGESPVLVLLSLGGLAFSLWARWDYVPTVDQGKREFGLAMQAVLPSRALGIISSDEKGIWDGEVFYVSDTRGWRASTRQGFSRRPISEESVEEQKERGAVFLAQYGPPADLEAKIPDLYRRLSAGHVLASGPDWIVFSLEE